MKTFVCAMVLLATAACGNAQDQAMRPASPELDQLSWLVGTWDRTNNREGESGVEIWESSPTGFKGRGLTMVGADTVFVEVLEIKLVENQLHYVVQTPGNDAPVPFRMSNISHTGFESENPEHDFPKKISYELDGNSLTAVISGDGQSMGFVFRKRAD